MSEQEQGRPIATNALEVDTLASDWIERRDFGPWTEADQRDLEFWLRQSLAHRIAFVRLDAGWKRTGRLAALTPPMRQPTSNPPIREPRLRLFWLAAAAITVAAIGSGAVFFVSQPAKTTYATNVGDREVLSLADGSQIELNTDTVLRTAVTASRRTVWLEKGEAYFRVKHDVAHPFVVVVGNRELTDLGTEFTVRRDVGRLQVVVVEGLVRLDDNIAQRHEAPTRILKPGDVVVATNTSMTVSTKSPRELENGLGWRRGVLVFDHTPLSEAATEINRYNAKKLVIADPVAAQLKIGGTFPKNNVNAISAAVRELFGLRVQDRGDEIVVSR